VIYNYVVYDTNTGLIKKTLTCDESSIQYNHSDTESYTVGTPEASHKYFLYGSFVEGTTSPSETKATLDRGIREIRESLLLTSDWTQMPDSPLSDEKKAEWAAYRQALRDLPANSVDVTVLSDVNFPTKP
jgi:hypothetical protein